MNTAFLLKQFLPYKNLSRNIAIANTNQCKNKVFSSQEVFEEGYNLKMFLGGGGLKNIFKMYVIH